MSSFTDKLLQQNQQWAKQQQQAQGDYFQHMAVTHKPQVCWLGCCDARVVPTATCQAPLGEVFLHTNVANQVHHHDDCTMSALGFAVRGLKVQHMVVCGHTQCAGIKTAIAVRKGDVETDDLWAKWIEPLQLLYYRNEDKFKGLDDNAQQALLSELNVKHQVAVMKQQITKGMLQSDAAPAVHGWLYQIEKGEFKVVA